MLEPEADDTSDPVHHAFAGGITGFLEYSFLYPLDFIKTRMQVLRPHPDATYESWLSCLLTVIKDEGLRRIFRGMSVPLLASVPAHAAYYVTYEQMKRVLSGTRGGYNSPLAQGISGAMAVVNHNIIMNPADVIKQRMQVYGSIYRSSFHCFVQVFRREGIRAFYRSLTTQIVIDIPYGAIHFVVYEYCQNVTNPTRTFSASSHLISGALAGGIAAAVTTPLDVCRTLLNIQGHSGLRTSKKAVVKGLTAAIRVVYGSAGVKGFFRGLMPRVLHHVPNVALCWIIYEFFKRYFVKRDYNKNPTV